ncbi:MAG TPA: hypothetical protein VII43_01125 [Opitutaceae bacterium]
MSRFDPGTDPMAGKRPTRAQVWLSAVGCAVLILGSIGSVAAYRVGMAYDARNSFVTDPIVAKQNDRRLEEIGGKSNVFAHDTTQWFASLWHGTRLAYTLAALALAIAALCFFTAHFLPEFPPSDDSPLDARDLRDRKPGPRPDS